MFFISPYIYKNDEVNFKIYDVINWETNNCNTLIAPNISRSKGNQTMKFGQLEYNMGNIFLETSCTKYGGETIPRPQRDSNRQPLSL